MSAQFPTEDVVESRIGTWETIAGQNPSATELVTAAEEILDGQVNSSEHLLQRTRQYIWRRQKMPHGAMWKRAEELCEQAHAEVQR